MAIFAKVVDEGSFRAAAKNLSLAPSRVSEVISELEDYLGITLLYRTTRKISLTNEGRIFHARILEMLSSAEAGLNELNSLSTEPAGTLRVSIPAFMVEGPLSKAVATFASKYPKVSFEVNYTDRRMNLVKDGYDLTIRVGKMNDSSVMFQKLAEGQRKLVGGTGYMQGRKMPQGPADLEDWDWVGFLQRPNQIEFKSPTGQAHIVTGSAQIESDSIEGVYNFVLQNSGITVLPSFLADKGIASGKLVELLPDWTLSPLGIYAVWPDKSRRESLTLSFARYLAEQELC